MATRNLISSSSEAGGRLWPTAAATALVVVLGCAALYHATLGLQAVSTEDGRRLEIAAAPRAVPAVALDLPTRPLLADHLRADGRVSIVSFIYARCNAVCLALGGEFQQLQAAIRARGLQDRVRLLSISFDARDSAAELADYGRRQHADAAIWEIAGVATADGRRALLNTFGVVVVPAPLGEFVHNAAFHLVDGGGRLVKVADFDQPERALDDALALALKGRQP